jgi:hypothetical protein
MTETNLFTIAKALETFATSHKQINAYQFGPMDEADIAKLSADKHPLLHVTCMGVSLDEGSVALDFDILVGTMQPPDLDSRANVLSNMLYIFKDVIAFLKHHDSESNFVSRGTLSLPVDADSFVVKLDSMLVGWQGQVTLTFDSLNNLCLVPD